MHHRMQIISIGTLALLGVLASLGCEDVELVRNVNTSQKRGLAGIQPRNVVFEPSLVTMSLRPDVNPERNIYYGDT